MGTWAARHSAIDNRVASANNRRMYRKPKWSDPAHEPPNIRFLTFKSPSLERRGDVTVYLPDGAGTMRDLPIVILLHGVYSSHWAWVFQGGVHEVASGLIAAGEIPPCCLLMPSDGLWGDGSAYFRHNGINYEAWIVDEVPACVTEELDCLSPASPRFLCGLSMGGFGALRLGARFPDRFRAVAAHSAITHFRHLGPFVEEPLAHYGMPTEGDKDPLHWMKRHRDRLPPIRFDCGVEDDLIEPNRELHRQMETERIPHVYEEFPGGHNWDYWHLRVADSLRFFFAQL